jgi:hypothetical protein
MCIILMQWPGAQPSFRKNVLFSFSFMFFEMGAKLSLCIDGFMRFLY